MAPRTLRIPDDMEALLRAAAGLTGLSVQAYIILAIHNQITRDAKSAKFSSLAAMLDGPAKKPR